MIPGHPTWPYGLLGDTRAPGIWAFASPFLEYLRGSWCHGARLIREPAHQYGPDRPTIPIFKGPRN